MLRVLLPSLQMIPIFRFRDGFRKMRRNPEAFRHFAEVLGENGWIAIYPEGSHLIKHTLRPLQKGVARIVFAAQEAEGWKREIPVIPVGLQYEDHTALGARLLIQFGPPISSLDFRAAHAENPKRAERELTEEVFEGMKPLLILPPQDDAAYQAAVEMMEENRNRFPDLMDQFRSDQELVAGVAGEAAEAVVSAGERASPGNVPAGLGQPWQGLRRFLGHALSLPGRILHLPASLVTMAIVAFSTKDPDLAPSARFLVAMFLFPLWYLGVLIFLHLQFQSLALNLFALLILPGSLWLWSRCWHWTW
jgi:hypothetical protein